MNKKYGRKGLMKTEEKPNGITSDKQTRVPQF